MQSTGPRRSTRRAALVALASLAGAVVVWRLRPVLPSARLGPNAEIVRGCAWVAWLLGGYLALAFAAAATSELAASAGYAASWLTRLAPRPLRAMVEAFVSVGVAATLLTSVAASPAGAVAPPAGAVAPPAGAVAPPAGAVAPPAGAVALPAGTVTLPAGTGSVPSALVDSALDWPGLSDGVTVHARPDPPPPPPRSATHPPAHVGLVTGGGADVEGAATAQGGVVVRPGDSLWSIAARHLPAGSSAAAIDAAWHKWYAANRDLIGADPGLLFPGQRLRPPPDPAQPSAVPAHSSRSPR